VQEPVHTNPADVGGPRPGGYVIFNPGGRNRRQSKDYKRQRKNNFSDGIHIRIIPSIKIHLNATYPQLSKIASR